MITNNVNIFSEPAEIDAIINAKLASLPARGGKCASRAAAWTEEELQLRDQVIMSYITENCLSKEKTAIQLTGRWNISISTARMYVRDAIERWSKNYIEETNENARKLWMEKCETILQDAIDTGDKQAALKALDLMGKSMGIYKDTKDLNVNGDVEISFDFKG